MTRLFLYRSSYGHNLGALRSLLPEAGLRVSMCVVWSRSVFTGGFVESYIGFYR